MGERLIMNYRSKLDKLEEIFSDAKSSKPVSRLIYCCRGGTTRISFIGPNSNMLVKRLNELHLSNSQLSHAIKVYTYAQYPIPIQRPAILDSLFAPLSTAAAELDNVLYFLNFCTKYLYVNPHYVPKTLQTFNCVECHCCRLHVYDNIGIKCPVCGSIEVKCNKCILYEKGQYHIDEHHAKQLINSVGNDHLAILSNVVAKPINECCSNYFEMVRIRNLIENDGHIFIHYYENAIIPQMSMLSTILSKYIQDLAGFETILKAWKSNFISW